MNRNCTPGVSFDIFRNSLSIRDHRCGYIRRQEDKRMSGTHSEPIRRIIPNGGHRKHICCRGCHQKNRMSGRCNLRTSRRYNRMNCNDKPNPDNIRRNTLPSRILQSRNSRILILNKSRIPDIRGSGSYQRKASEA